MLKSNMSGMKDNIENDATGKAKGRDFNTVFGLKQYNCSMNILVVLADKSKREIASFTLESRFQAETHQAANFEAAIDYLLDDHDVSVIVCEAEKESARLFKYLLSVDSSIPLIIIAKKEEAIKTAFPDLNVIGHVDSANLAHGVFQVISDAIQAGTLKEGMGSNDYCRIKSELLIKVAPLKSDIYIRLSKIKFVKLFKEGDTFDVADFNKYVHQKKVDYLYIKREESGEFVSRLQKELLRITSSENVPPESLHTLAISAHEVILELGKRVGFTPEVQALAKESIKLTIKSVGNNPKLSKMLRSFVRDKKRYITSHSVALADIACSLAAKMDWPSEATFQKLCFAAFFHDIALSNNELAAVSDLADLENKKAQFSAAEIRAFKDHPFKGMEVVRSFKEIPADVDLIVHQHHELPDGSGFPRGVNYKHISPLSALFIVAHDLVQYMYDYTTVDFDEFIKERKVKYDSGTFKKVISRINKEMFTGEGSSS
ncbi:HD domain-containing phosphohydrolase [Bdellovibrionota bacterium FG-2]